MDDMIRLLLLHASINIVLISYICFPKKIIMLFRIPTLQRKFVCYFSAIISQANHMAGAVTPSLLRRMCSWSICRCNRVGAAGLTKIKNIYLNYWFLNNPHMQKSHCMCLCFDITGELKITPKLAETTDELIF